MSGKSNNSKMKTNVTVIFFFSPLWILMSLMIKYISEHYKLHLWKKWGKLIGKQLWNWRVAKSDTLSIQVAKLNLLLVCSMIAQKKIDQAGPIRYYLKTQTMAMWLINYFAQSINRAVSTAAAHCTTQLLVVHVSSEPWETFVIISC